MEINSWPSFILCEIEEVHIFVWQKHWLGFIYKVEKPFMYLHWDNNNIKNAVVSKVPKIIKHFMDYFRVACSIDLLIAIIIGCFFAILQGVIGPQGS